METTGVLLLGNAVVAAKVRVASRRGWRRIGIDIRELSREKPGMRSGWSAALHAPRLAIDDRPIGPNRGSVGPARALVFHHPPGRPGSAQ